MCDRVDDGLVGHVWCREDGVMESNRVGCAEVVVEVVHDWVLLVDLLSRCATSPSPLSFPGARYACSFQRFSSVVFCWDFSLSGFIAVLALRPPPSIFAPSSSRFSSCVFLRKCSAQTPRRESVMMNNVFIWWVCV